MKQEIDILVCEEEARMRARILIVEDEGIFAADLKQRLEALGYTVVGCVPSGEKALAEVGIKTPDLILLDIHLEGKMDGFQVAQQVRERFQIPVVFITAYADEETLRRAKVTEPVGYLVKPIGRRELEPLIEMALYRHNTEKERNAAQAKAHALELRIAEQQKMEAVGRVAAAMAHDLNNALTGVVGNIEYLRHFGGLSADMQRHLHDANLGAERCAAFIRKLLLVVGKAHSQAEVLNLPKLVLDTVNTFSATAAPSLTVATKMRSADLLVRGDRQQISQMIINLLVNAKEALSGSGEITVECHQDFVDNPTPFNPHATPGSYVVLRVCDQGVGIQREVLSKVFDPFYTSKPQGKGLGMGLSMVYGTMQSHLGWIVVESDGKSGSTFTLYFPGTESAVVESAVAN